MITRLLDTEVPWWSPVLGALIFGTLGILYLRGGDSDGEESSSKKED